MTPETDPLSGAAKGLQPPAVEPYDDLDLMGFGKYINERLQDVPASYLHYLWTKRPLSDPRLEAYIKKNLHVLKQEHPDGIWT